MDIKDIKRIFSTRVSGSIGDHRFYSVLVPFVSQGSAAHGDDISLLYEVRATGIRQPGEICFPGGHVEDGETPEECAVRETCEELGVEPGDISVIAQGDTLYGDGNFTLYTFIGEIRFDAGLKPDPEEVSEVFTVPVKTLMEAEPDHYGEKLKPEIAPDFPYEKVGIGRDYPWRTSEHDIPIYNIDGWIIWGMTARITERVIAILNKSDNEEACDSK